MTMRRTLRITFFVQLVLAIVAFGQDRQVSVERDVDARMRDGVVLRADVYRPDGDGPWPVLVERTPYGKQGLHPETLVNYEYPNGSAWV